MKVRYRPPGETLRSGVAAVDGISFDLPAGEALGVLGESGCGKTSLALAILGLLPPAGEIAGGEIRFQCRNLEGLPERRIEQIRGAEIGLIFQEPALALHPTRKIGEQVAEVLHAHRPWGWRRCREQARELLAEVDLEVEAGIGETYPHQLSGGQRQRVVIAQALACRPRLLIADEPTAALDTTTQARILALLRRLKRRLGTAFLFISHDPRVLAEIADRLLVMYAGQMVEEGPREQVLGEPFHPYTEALLRCLPTFGAAEPGRELHAIPGSAPMPRELLAAGCRFAPRCSYKMPICGAQDPPELGPRKSCRVWCFRYDEPDDVGNDAGK